MTRLVIAVLAYDDGAEGTIPVDDPPTRIVAITLRPRIVVEPRTDIERVRALCKWAHHECYDANSLKTEVRAEPEIVVGEESRR